MVRGLLVRGSRVRGRQPLALHPRTLRTQWWQKVADASWAFPSDWAQPAVDAVCEAIAADRDVWASAERLGATRAASGVGLGEALADVDALAALVPERYVDVLRRALSLGWADRVVAPHGDVSDPLTGLASAEYLKVRLGELYRGGEVSRAHVDMTHALAVVRVDLSSHEVWQRALPMILVGDALRTVFDGGQTLARLGESCAVVVTERDGNLPRRVGLAGSMIESQLIADPDISARSPRVWIESLPVGYGSALDLIGELGR